MTHTAHIDRELKDNLVCNEGLHQGLNVFTGTRCGWYHEKNEDYILHNLENGFFGLADGVGGGQLGDVAAEELLKFLNNQHQSLPTSEQIIHDLKISDAHIKNLLAKHNARGAATVVLAWLDENAKGFLSNVGDARIYLLDIQEPLDDVLGKVKLKQITIDQTYENMGISVPENRHADDPIRMVGIGAVGEPPIYEIELKHNQALFLCSDGIHKFLTSEEMESVCEEYFFNHSDDLPLESIGNALVQKAIENESHDDCTVMIVLNYQPHGDIQKNETVDENKIDNSLSESKSSTEEDDDILDNEQSHENKPKCMTAHTPCLDIEESSTIDQKKDYRMIYRLFALIGIFLAFIALFVYVVPEYRFIK